jgi:leucyl-tRNA synthetase
MSEYNHIDIEKKWRNEWRQQKTYKTFDDYSKEKYYVLDMFPYPSGAGLHVGHPLGYIASDIVARYKRNKGFNVLHPMGYDSFGLPAEQYAIQTGQHPAITTEQNIARYREQLDKIGFSFDWEREVRTSDPNYYKWTQWIFKEIYNSWYNKTANKAQHIDTLILLLEKEGNANIEAVCEETAPFTSQDWNNWDTKKQQSILMNYRLAFLADSWVNWCPALGTVLANDEIKDGVSERGGHPVEQKLMRQWSMRITAYAERLLEGLEKIDFSDSLKEQQRNWIGKSKGAMVRFEVDSIHSQKPQTSNLKPQTYIEVFTTRPDTIFGVSFMVLAPEHDLVDVITTAEQKEHIENYKKLAAAKSERDRQANVKNITGAFTGAYAIHPFTGNKIQIWIGDYVLATYGTGAVMAVPAGDQRDWDFASHFGIEIPNIFKDTDISKEACADKTVTLTHSDFLNGLTAQEGIEKAIEAIEKKGIGKGKINYRLRDAIFSRQRYWGEPFPVYYKDDVPHLIDDADLPVTLPEVDKYLPTEDGEPPLARAEKAAWNIALGDRMEYNTMPGWAGSSWYFLRYMDPHNEQAFVSKEKADYWQQVDLYIGGAEHATGHLLYSRFWTKFLFDMGYINFDEPFKKLINQGMILGRSSLITSLAKQSGLYDASKELVPTSEYKNVYLSAGYIEIVNKYYLLENNDKSVSNYTRNEREDIYEEYSNLVQKLKEINAQEISRVKAKNEYDETKYSFAVDYSECLFSNSHIDIKYVDNDKLDIHSASKDPMFNYLDNSYIITDKNGDFICGHEIEKMSKSKYNVQTPDELVEKFGADTLRCYEMFLGPLEQFKPWDVKGINGVNNFLKKLWRLFHQGGSFTVSEGAPSAESLKTVHKTIKKVTEDIDRYSFNTVVSTMMICVNELTDQKCNNRQVLSDVVVLLSPYAPHLAEEIWQLLGNTASVTKAPWPVFNEAFLVESSINYPISFNGKVRFTLSLPADMPREEVEKVVMAEAKTQQYLEGNAIKKMIVVPGKIVNIVV